MSKGGDIYRTLKQPAATVAGLSDAELRALLGHLGRKGKISGPAGRIWGEALAEAAIRFMQPKTHEASEGTEALTDFITPDPDA